jgi:hypothetical protein
MERSILRHRERRGLRHSRTGDLSGRGSMRPVLRREDRLPVIFHADDNPAFDVRLVESCVETAERCVAII